jgi:hypothetical protein
MATVRESYDEMLKTTIGPSMRARSFTKARNAFRRWSGRAWQIVDFQASQFGSRNDVSFTINLGLAYPELRTDEDAWAEGRAPSIGSAHVQERIGRLMPGGEDHWWAVTADTSLAALAADLLDLIATVAVPWLDARGDLDRTLAGVRERDDFLPPWIVSTLAVRLDRAGYADLAQELNTLPAVERWRNPRAT